MICGARVLALAAILGSLWTGTGDARTSADGGSGTYTATGTTVFFDLFDAGTTPWQYFVLVGPAGTRFVGAATSAENTARCVPTLPDGRAESIECGPIAPTVMRPGSHLLLVGTMTAPVACGARFELDVSSDGVQPFTRGGDLTQAGSCAGALRAVAPPRIGGIGRPGHRLTASAATWSTTPERVAYQWQLCTRVQCKPLKGATARSLRVTRRLVGEAVRVVETATANGVAATIASKSVRVR
jgi:hypothetical protein